MLDSIDHYIEHKRRIKLPAFNYSKVTWGNTPLVRDGDIFAGLNVIQPVPNDTLAYPEFIVSADSGKTKPALLCIGDSFWWGIYCDNVLDKIFTHPQFWQHNNEIFTGQGNQNITVPQLNVKEEVLKQDVILIVATEASYPKMGWGFIENAYKLFGGK